MPFAGESLEEFVGEYFRYVKGYLVETHIDYVRKKEWYDDLNIKQKKKQDRWSDIDVLAVDTKSKRAVVVSCSEGAKKVEDLDKELKFAEKFVKENYGFQTIDRIAAFVFFYDFIGEIDAYTKS